MMKPHPTGRVNYLINGKSFENEPNKRDAKEKAIQYCLDNFIDPKEIIKFDSRTERDRYLYLKELERVGMIENLTHHFILLVQEEYINSAGDKIPAITYNADFVYKDNVRNVRVVEDVKGTTYFIDEHFSLLKKVFDYKFKEKGLYIAIILRKGDEWQEYKFGEPKTSKKMLKKQREKIKALEAEKKENEKKEKLRKRLNELMNKPKLTKQEQARVLQIENILKK